MKVLILVSISFFLFLEVSAQERELREAERVVSNLYERNTGRTIPSRPSLSEDHMFSDTQIMIEVDAQFIREILQHGIRNQFETGGSEYAASSPKSRAERKRLENRAAGDEFLDDEIRPKYAFLIVTKKVSPSRRPRFTMGEFGDVMFVLKDSVKGRSTWTPEDSLASNSQFRTFYESSEDLRKVPGYAEAQIWGPLNMSDVKEVWVKEGSEVADLLIEFGLPVYEYGYARYANGDRYHKRLKQLSSGIPKVIKSLKRKLRAPWKNWLPATGCRI